jgi:hypothetical protein
MHDTVPLPCSIPCPTAALRRRLDTAPTTYLTYFIHAPFVCFLSSIVARKRPRQGRHFLLLLHENAAARKTFSPIVARKRRGKEDRFSRCCTQTPAARKTIYHNIRPCLDFELYVMVVVIQPLLNIE